MSHYKNDRSTYYFKLYKAIEADRGLKFDYRLKERTYERPSLFRRNDGYLQPDYRHQVRHFDNFYQRMCLDSHF